MRRNYKTDVTKSKMTTKSTARKPLRDVSNASAFSKPPPTKSAAVNLAEQRRENDGDALDRLLLVHSDLSSLIQQLDELIVQALKSTSMEDSKEIELFADVLSKVHVSLKPWVGRFQRAAIKDNPQPENNLEQASPLKLVPAVNQEASSFIPFPEENEWDSLVSPSPLVSWRPDSNNEGGRQLFLLTPLPRAKAFVADCQRSVKSETNSTTIAVQPSALFNIEGEKEDDLIGGAFQKQTPTKVFDSSVIKAGNTLETEFVSPAKAPTKGISMFLMTPCLKVSPPKSCVLLEPTSEFPQKGDHVTRKSTPYPVGLEGFNTSDDSESSGSRSSEHLSMKYPELMGIRIGHDYGNRRKVAEESPNWLGSPLKTCVLMEPPEEKLLTDCINQQTESSFVNENFTRENGPLAVDSCKKETRKTSEMVEFTPLLKEPESNLRFGKQPGENTLKRELWTKFEAASIHGIHFNSSALEKTAKKGFLDKLDEVCCDEKIPAVDGLY